MHYSIMKPIVCHPPPPLHSLQSWQGTVLSQITGLAPGSFCLISFTASSCKYWHDPLPPYQDNVQFLWEQSKFKERYTQRSICSYSCQSPKATCSSLFSLSLLLNFTQVCTHRVECTCKDNFKLLFFFTVIIFKFYCWKIMWELFCTNELVRSALLSLDNITFISISWHLPATAFSKHRNSGETSNTVIVPCLCSLWLLISFAGSWWFFFNFTQEYTCRFESTSKEYKWLPIFISFIIFKL